MNPLHTAPGSPPSPPDLPASIEPHLSVLADVLPEIVWIGSPDGAIRFVNRRWYEFVGARPPAARAPDATVDWQAHVHEDDRAQVQARWEQLLAAGRAPQIEFRLRGADGQYHWVLARARPLVAPCGRTERWIGCLVDIDEQVRMRAELTEARERLLVALQAGRMGIWDWTPGTGEVHWNQAMFEMLGLPHDGDRATGEAFIGLVVPEDRPSVRQAIEQALASCGGLDAQFRIRHADGGLRWMSVKGRVHCDARGKPVRMTGVNFDITATKQTLQALHAADRHKTEFLAMLAHELRNPLAPIVNAIRLLEAAGHSAEHRTHSTRILRRQSAHLSRLVDDLLEVSRITQGRIELRRTNFLVGAAVYAALDTVRPMLQARRQTLSVDVPATLELVADATRVTQILSNLLNNACKYTPEGGAIAVSARAEANDVVLQVRDNGHGIAPELLPRVFDLFTQAERTLDRSQGGLGIGLALVRQLARLHGGSAEVHSAGPEQGTTFTVRLPHRERRAQARPAPTEPITHRIAPVSMLVVDDDRDSAETMRLLLQMDGHAVQVAYDGPQAVEAVRRHHPQVVLLDLRLPGASGLDVARAVRAEHDLPQPVLVAMSGFGRREDRQRSLEAGLDAHLVKPLQLDELYQALARLLAERQAPASGA